MLRTTLRLGASNVYLLDAGGSLVAIDAGPDYDGAWDSVQAQLDDAGLAPADVQTVLVTHGHVDHCTLASYWQRQAGAGVWIAGPDAARMRSGGRDAEGLRTLALRFLAESGVPEEVLARRENRPRHLPGRRNPGFIPRPVKADGSGEPGPERVRTPDGRHRAGNRDRLANLRSMAPEHGEWPAPLKATPATPDALLEPGTPLALGGLRLEPLLCPGHTPGSVVFLDDATGDLYTGDHVLERIAPTPGIQFTAEGERFRSLPLYLRSLAAVRDLAPRRVLPGHGDPFTDLAGAVDRITRTFEQRALRLLRRLQQSPDTAWGLAHRLYPHLRPHATWIVLAEITGLLDLLEERGAVALESDAPRVFRATGR